MRRLCHGENLPRYRLILRISRYEHPPKNTTCLGGRSRIQDSQYKCNTVACIWAVRCVQPPKGTKLASPASEEPNTKKARARTPWTEEEVMHLNAAVKALGKGKWSKALSSYKFQDCRTAVDLKDKWRNLQKI